MHNRLYQIIEVLSVLFIFLLGESGWSNSAPIPSSGILIDSISVVKNDSIRMIRERVDIDCDWFTYKVSAKFWFENTSKTSQTVDIGFPVDCDPIFYGKDGLDVELLDKALSSFRVL